MVRKKVNKQTNLIETTNSNENRFSVVDIIESIGNLIPFQSLFAFNLSKENIYVLHTHTQQKGK